MPDKPVLLEDDDWIKPPHYTAAIELDGEPVTNHAAAVRALHLLGYDGWAVDIDAQGFIMVTPTADYAREVEQTLADIGYFEVEDRHGQVRLTIERP